MCRLAAHVHVHVRLPGFSQFCATVVCQQLLRPLQAAQMREAQPATTNKIKKKKDKEKEKEDGDSDTS